MIKLFSLLNKITRPPIFEARINGLTVIIIYSSLKNLTITNKNGKLL